MEIWPACSRVVEPVQENSETKPMPEILELILELPLQWRSSLSVDGKIVSLEIFTDKENMR